MKKKKDGFITEAVSPVIGIMLMLVVTIIIAAVVSGFAGDMGLDKKTGPSVVLSEPAMEFSTEGATTESITLDYTYYTTSYEYYYEDGYEEENNDPGSSSTKNVGTLTLLTDDGDPYGLVFTHEGGDPIDLKDLQMGFSSNDLGIAVDYNSVRAGVPTNSASGNPDRSAYVGLNTSDVYEEGEQGSDYYYYYEKESTLTGIDVSGGYSLDEFYELYDQIKSGESSEGLIEPRYFYKINPETGDDTIIRTGDQFEVAMDGTPVRWSIQAYNDGIYQSFYIEAGSGAEWILSHRPSGQILARGDLVYPDNTDE